MPGYDLIIAFVVTTSVFAYMPGPATLYAATQTLARGRRAGWQAAAGLHVGGYLHVFAAAFGLALVFEAVPELYTALKYAGATYLIYLGIRMVFATSAQHTQFGDHQDTKDNTFWQSVTVEVLNPKTALFYIAFLPQFTAQSAALPIWAQLLILGAVVNVMFSSADLISVMLADRITKGLQTSAGRLRIIKQICGGMLVGLGLYAALS